MARGDVYLWINILGLNIGILSLQSGCLSKVGTKFLFSVEWKRRGKYTLMLYFLFISIDLYKLMALAILYCLRLHGIFCFT